MANMYLKIDDELEQLVDEISALSGIQKGVIREVWEFTLIHWAEQLARNPNKLNSLTIPFLGSVGVRYTGDVVEETGEVSTAVDSFISLNPLFKKMVGDIVDEGDSVVTDLLKKKIVNALLSISSSS